MNKQLGLISIFSAPDASWMLVIVFVSDARQ